jgi:cytochrome c oxidase assembly factor CtaG
MNALLDHWSFDPFLVGVALVVLVHARGLSRMLSAVSRAGRPTRPWVVQAVLWWTGLLVLVLAVVSPVDYWSGTYLTAHVVQHLMLAFVAPALVVLGAPWLPVLRGLPRPVARAYGRMLQRLHAVRPGGRSWRTAAAVVAVCSRPWTSVVAFNTVMVFWHLPGPFDLAEGNDVLHIWAVHGAFFGLGVALWLQVFESRPFRPVLQPAGRLLALVTTNATMVLIAMTLVMFSHDLYPWYSLVVTPEVQAADQQVGGGILWVCGEVTFLPAILYTVARWMDDSGSRPAPVPLRVGGVPR